MRNAIKIFLWMYVIVVLFAAYQAAKGVSSCVISIYLVLLLNSITIPLVLYYKRVNIHEPVLWFSAYYFMFTVSMYAMLFDGFQSFPVIALTEFDTNLYCLFSKTGWMIWLGYGFLAIGYFVFRRKNTSHDLSINKIPSAGIFKVFAVFLFVLGATNFLVNIYVLTDFDFIEYISKFGYYSGYASELGVSRLGYNLLYPALFLYVYLYLEKKITSFHFFTITCFIFLIILSAGRITAFVTTVLSVYLMLQYYKGIFYLDYKKVIVFASFGGFILTLFFLRIYSDYSRVYGMPLDAFFDEIFLGGSREILLGKGNLPNLAILMKIVDGWEADIGFLYGQSIVYGLFSLFQPYGVLEITPVYVSHVLTNEWYPDGILTTGAIPPTILGEFYANGGFLAALFGMLILGWGGAFLYNRFASSSSYLLASGYFLFLTKFAFILPKGEINRINLMFSFLVILFFFMVLYFVIVAIRTGVRKPTDRL